MKIGGQILWNAIPICESFKISYLMGRPHMKGDLENLLKQHPISAKDQKVLLGRWLLPMSGLEVITLLVRISSSYSHLFARWSTFYSIASVLTDLIEAVTGRSHGGLSRKFQSCPQSTCVFWSCSSSPLLQMFRIAGPCGAGFCLVFVEGVFWVLDLVFNFVSFRVFVGICSVRATTSSWIRSSRRMCRVSR